MVKVRTSVPQATPRRTNPPRPPNAWILFRQSVAAEVERDLAIAGTHQLHASQIASARWHALSIDEKDFWQSKAKDARHAHALKYPNYEFKPETTSAVERRKRCIANQREGKDLTTATVLKMARKMDALLELEALKKLQVGKNRGHMTSQLSARGSKTSIPVSGSYSTTPVPSTVPHLAVTDRDIPPFGSQFPPMSVTTLSSTPSGVDRSTCYQRAAHTPFELVDNSFNMSDFLPALFHDDGSLRESDMVPPAELSQ